MDSSTWRARLGRAAAVALALTATAHAGNAQVPPLNPFQCYEIKPRQFQAIPGVNVVDPFGNHVARVRFPHRLCAPAVARPIGDRAAALFDGEHLIGHVVDSPNVKVTNQVIVNQFGTLTLDVWRPDLLLVPTLKSLTSTPPPLTQPTIDHFQCYKVKRSQGAAPFTRINDVLITDQFGNATLDVIRPVRLCVPANKNDEDPSAPSHPQSLLCYRTRNSRFGTVQTYTNSQFGPEKPTLIHRRELCVPSERNPPPTTTSTSSTTTTTDVPTSTTFPPSSTTFPPTSTTFPSSTTFPPSTTVPTTSTTTTTEPVP
jgi:hypothetical protein